MTKTTNKVLFVHRFHDMPYREDKRIEFPVPFLKEDTVLYVPDDMGMFSARWMENCRYAIVSLFRSAGKKLILLPDFLRTLDSDLLRYMFPGQDSHVVEEAVYRHLVDLIGTGGCPGFLYRQGGAVYYHAVAAATDDQALWDIKGKKYFDYPMKYYCEDIGLRNARLDFREIDPPHAMENVIYNELVRRGHSVDVGVVP